MVMRKARRAQGRIEAIPRNFRGSIIQRELAHLTPKMFHMLKVMSPKTYKFLTGIGYNEAKFMTGANFMTTLTGHLSLSGSHAALRVVTKHFKSKTK